LAKLWRLNRFGFRRLTEDDVPAVLEKVISGYQGLGPCAEKGKLLNLSFFAWWSFGVRPFVRPLDVVRFLRRFFAYEQGSEDVDVLVFRGRAPKAGLRPEALFLVEEEFAQINFLFRDMMAHRGLEANAGLFLVPNPWAVKTGALFLEHGVDCVHVEEWPRFLVEVAELDVRIPSFGELREAAVAWRVSYGCPSVHLHKMLGYGRSEAHSPYLSVAAMGKQDAALMRARLMSEQQEGAFVFFSNWFFVYLCVCG